MRRFRVLLHAITLLGTAACATERSAANQSLVALRAIEQQIGGRLGVACIDNQGAVITSYRGEERFAMCSTFKAALAAALFAAHERGHVDMFARFAVTENDLVPYAPFVAKRLATETPVSLHELAKAAVEVSDNAAANLVIQAIGGPPGFTAFVRASGDAVTRLDRIEPELNHCAPGDPRDTTSPLAMARLLQVLLGDSTEPRSGSQTLRQWLQASSTGYARIRAGLPPEWPVGDKTGTGPNGSAYNDVAIIWPAAAHDDPAPVMLAVYTDQPTASRHEVDAAIAAVARIVAQLLDRTTAVRVSTVTK